MVIVWLGRESITSRNAFVFPKEFVKAVSEIEKEGIAAPISHMNTMLYHPHFNPSWEGILHLLNRPWWSRAELVRELILSSKAVVVRCGNHELELSIFFQFFSGLLTIELLFRKLSIKLPSQISEILKQIPSNFFRHLELQWASNRSKRSTPTLNSVLLVEMLSSGFRYMAVNDALDWILTTTQNDKYLGPLLTHLSLSVAGRYSRICLERASKEDHSHLFERDAMWDVKDNPINSETVAEEYSRLSRKWKEHKGKIMDVNIICHEANQAGYNTEALLFNVSSAISTNPDDEAAMRLWLRILRLMNTSVERGIGSDSKLPTETGKDKLKDLGAQGNIDLKVQEATPRYNEFVYERLNTTAQEIRILVMYPSDDPASDICCELVPVDLAFFSKLGIERYPFMALSYVWGDLSPVEMRGRRIRLTS